MALLLDHRDNARLHWGRAIDQVLRPPVVVYVHLTATFNTAASRLVTAVYLELRNSDDRSWNAVV